jgi:hypothetical protein
VWEASREEHEAALRDALVVPDGAVSVAVSIDGVLAPIDAATAPPTCVMRRRARGAPAKAQPATARWAARR